MTDPANLEVVIFNSALELLPAQRAAYLDQACAGDVALREQVEALLRADEKAGAFLEAHCDLNRAARMPVACGEKTGERVGRYRLLQQIGEGGCGIVYMAEQEEPVRRRVALKVIKLGMDTHSVIARFEAERQALALMDHPNIATVLDAGATVSGRPYFVMELVRGVRITDYCDQANLSTRNRLTLFIQVCHAIQHAHQKGVIHRDIKPSNVLVTVNDGIPIPKVIDFGIAKAAQGRLTDKTLFTAFEQFIGTPAYMSPEQAVMTSLDIDTRSDIYSLGVLLYELLTGCTPFDQKELLAVGFDEMRRTIREKEPPRPSTRLTHELLAAGVKRLPSKSRIHAPQNEPPPGASPHLLLQMKRRIQLVRGDLDWIVMKCLEKDRARRYASANGLAADIERYLDNSPIVARPPSALYRLQKTVRRNKAAFAMATAIIVVLVIGIIASFSQAFRATHAEREQVRLRKQAETASRNLLENLTLLELRRGEDSFHAGDAAGGLAGLAAVLRRDPSNHIAASRLVSALVHRNWALPATPPLRRKAKVENVAFTPDGLHVVSSSNDRAIQTWDAASGLAIETLHYEGSVVSAGYCWDPLRMVTASAGGAARVWKGSQAVDAPILHRGKLYWAEFSPDGAWLVTAAAGETVQVWDAATGALKLRLPGSASESRIARFSPDGKNLVTGGGTAPLCIWSVETGQILYRLQEAQDSKLIVAFSPNGERLLAASTFGKVRLWNPHTGEPIPQALFHASEVLYAAFSRDSQIVATCYQDGEVRLWRAEKGEPTGRTLLHDGGVTFAEFSPDGQLLVTASVDNLARVWHVQTGTLFCQPFRHAERVVQARFDPAGRRVVTGGDDGVVRVWDMRFRRSLGLQVKHAKGVMALAFSPNGERMLTGSLDQTARLWSTRTGEEVVAPMRYEAGVECAQFSEDGKRILTASNDGTAHVRDAVTGNVVAGPLRHAKAIWSAQFSPDGLRVATASEDGTARIWDAQTGQPLTPPLQHKAEVVSVRFSVDGHYIVTASKDFTARIWDVQTGASIGEPLRHVDQLRWAEFSPDGHRIVTASSDNSACIWDVHTSQRTALLQHARIVERALFSPDGRRVLTASLDRTAKIWDATSGQLVTEPIKHAGPISRGVSFSPDGSRVATSAWNGSVRLWDTATSRPLTEWLEAGSDVWTLAFDGTNQRIAVGTRGGSVRVWEIPPAPSPVPDWFLQFVDGLAGIRMDVQGNLELVPGEQFHAFSKHPGQNANEQFYAKLIDWFLANPKTRPMSPF